MQYPLQELDGESGKIVCFESYGVRMGIRSNYPELLRRIANELDDIFPINIKAIDNSNLTKIVEITKKPNGFIEFSIDGEEISGSDSEENVYKFLLSRIRLTVAEFAVSKVFVHSGVVVWKQKAIVIPGNSFSGKTTLVKELIDLGASYFSDEYAIFDENGLVHPFPKTISIRGIVDDFIQVEHTPEELGATVGTKPIEVGQIVFTKFEKGASWQPKILTAGEAVLKIVSFTLPIRVAPAFTLEVLQKVTSRAASFESKRGDAKKVAARLLKDFDNPQN